MTYGTKLRKFRNIRGYSQKFVAKELGISQNAYSKMENDKTQIKAETIEKVSKILEIDKLKLLDDDANNSLNFEKNNAIKQNQDIFNSIEKTEILETKIFSQQLTIESQKETIKAQNITINLLFAEIKRLKI